ncbi:MAG TPA: tRNA (adenosine(37)-N6)-threonylcarbamoyltransferase complex dimerization subunit type 1 TsaB [Pyrinomonadaceae bacterium]|nr:tRNA (adenosine(37)-N6)-threonylcarbamoyltransferase complex dimerization subunit type 1 TsaB [Pyrinomonadaceae bacterium]
MSNRADFHTPERHTETSDDSRAARADAGPLLLCVDTATEERSAAVFRGRTQLALRANDLRAGGASGVLRDVDEVLRAAGVSLREIELFAACTGPGSFTGLRSGLATVKALSRTLRRPAVGVPTLHAVAHGARPSRRLYALLPAGRGEVFAQLLSVGEEGEVSELEEPLHLPPARLLERAKASGGGLKWAGSGALKYLGLIEEAAKQAGFSFVKDVEERAEPRADEWTFAHTPSVLAPSVAALALSSFRGGAHAGVEQLRAIYVRPSDAELNEQCQE